MQSKMAHPLAQTHKHTHFHIYQQSKVKFSATLAELLIMQVIILFNKKKTTKTGESTKSMSKDKSNRLVHTYVQTRENVRNKPIKIK